MSRLPRFYIEVQDYLRKRLEDNIPPTTAEIQSTIYGRSFDIDSKHQREVIYSNIAEGRQRALDQWDVYMGSDEFRQDFAIIEFYGDTDILSEDKNDYYLFQSALSKRRFGEQTDNIKEYLQEYIIVSKLWKKKLREYSKELNNLVISTYGNKAKWILPSWWRWAIRETDLYLRSVRTLQNQLRRGISTNLLTASGEPISKAIGLAKSIEGLLEDGSSWRCPNCEMINHGSSNFCSNCGHKKPEEN